MNERHYATLSNETVTPFHRDDDCRNWYALFTMTGTEMKIRREISELLKPRFDLFLPRRELFHRFQGNDRKVIKPLFPGYIFIHEQIESLMVEIRHTHLSGRLHPVMCNHRYAMVDENEMALLKKISDSTGLVQCSRAVWREGRSIIIKSGPLKELTGRILYVSKRKKKARVRITLLQRALEVTLGLEILEPV